MCGCEFLKCTFLDLGTGFHILSVMTLSFRPLAAILNYKVLKANTLKEFSMSSTYYYCYRAIFKAEYMQTIGICS